MIEDIQNNILIILAILYLLLAIREDDKTLKETRIVFAFIILLSVIINPKFNIQSNMIPILYAVNLIIIILYIIYIQIDSKKLNKIYAKQNKWWDISIKDILNKNKIFIKKKGITDRRNEIEIEEDITKKFFDEDALGNKTLKQKVIQEAENYNTFSFITSIDYFEDTNNEIHKMIFFKCKEIRDNSEKDINFENLIEENKYILEFFLLDIWKMATKNFNQSINTLWTLEKNSQDKELLGALMNVEEDIIKPFGLNLYINYLMFKKEQ